MHPVGNFGVGSILILLKVWFSFSVQNLAANPKCSLLVAKEPEDRGTLVVTVHGDAVPVRCIAYVQYLFLLSMCRSVSLLVCIH